MMSSNALLLLLMIIADIAGAEDDASFVGNPSVDHLRVAIVIDNSSNATPPWRQATTMMEATAKFFTFYDRKMLANQTRYVVSVIKIPIFDDPLGATILLCKRIQRETNLIGIIVTDSTPTFRGFIGELSRSSAIPVIELFTITSMAMMPVAPHYNFYMCDVLISAVQEAIEAYKWVNMLLIYDTPLNLACVNQLLGNPRQIGHALALALTDANMYEVVYTIKTKWKAIIVACDENRTMRFMQLALRMGILSHDYTFIFTNPDIHLNSMEEFALNMPNLTFFRFVSKSNFTLDVINVARQFEELQPKYKVLAPATPAKSGVQGVLVYDQEVQISMASAMLFDALLLFRTVLENLIMSSGGVHWSESVNGASCKNPTVVQQGKAVEEALGRESIEGLTGLAKFNSSTRMRETFVVDVLGLGSLGLRRIGTFVTNGTATRIQYPSSKPGAIRQLRLEKDIYGLLNQLPSFVVRPNKSAEENPQPKKTVVTVTTILEKPYAMYKRDPTKKKQFGKSRSVQDHNFEGYCIDLLEEIAAIVGFEYLIQPVADGRYGSYNATSGRWNGMVGEVVEGKAMMAVAPLTITYAREQAVDFTKPFINLGISILYVQPFKTKPSIFSFMQPLATEVWIAVAIAFVTVTIVLFCLGHILDCAFIGEEPKKTTKNTPIFVHPDIPVQPKGPRKLQAKVFNFISSAHFTIGGIVHHGSTVVPETLPSRCISVFWWFFAMIIISSYTANLAAFLTVETLVSPFENAEELAKRTNILYGAVKGGSTENFFRESKIDTYRRMWAFMKDKDVFPRNNSDGIERVRKSKGGYAYLMESVSMEYIISNDNKDCQLRQVGSLLDSKGYGIATAKGASILHEVSLAILQLQENDRLHLLYEKWWKASGQSCEAEDNVAKVLEIQNVLGIFLILVIGLGFSFIVLPLEILWYHRKQRFPKEQRSYFERVKESFMLPFLNSRRRLLILMKMNSCSSGNGYVNDPNVWQARHVKQSFRVTRRNASRAQRHRYAKSVQLKDVSQSLDRGGCNGGPITSPRNQRSASLTYRQAPPSSLILSPLSERKPIPETWSGNNDSSETSASCKYWNLQQGVQKLLTKSLCRQCT